MKSEQEPPAEPNPSEAAETEKADDPSSTDSPASPQHAKDRQGGERGVTSTKGGDKVKRKRPILRVVLWSVSLLLIAVVGVAGYLVANVSKVAEQIFEGSIFDLIFVERNPAKQDLNGRTNFLIFGTSPAGHPGSHLTDSIIVLSVDNASDDAFMVSIPRDLWVNFEKPCWVGYAGKINAAYVCGRDETGSPKDGALALSRQMKQVLGLDIQYHIHLNWDVVRRTVDAVGGIEVTIKSSDSRGIYDVATGLGLSNGTHHINGATALNLTRARNSKGGYGISDSDFGRTQNQQLVLRALQKKAMDSGTLADLGKVTDLLNAMGDNLRTNIEVSELQSLIDLALAMDMSQLESVNLADKSNRLVVGDRRGSQYIVRPAAGMGNFSAIHAAIKNRIRPNPVYLEGAKIAVLNNTVRPERAQEEAQKLQELGFNIISFGGAKAQNLEPVEVFRLGPEAQPAAETALIELFQVEIREDILDYLVVDEAEYVIIFSPEIEEQDEPED